MAYQTAELTLMALALLEKGPQTRKELTVALGAEPTLTRQRDHGRVGFHKPSKGQPGRYYLKFPPGRIDVILGAMEGGEYLTTAQVAQKLGIVVEERPKLRGELETLHCLGFLGCTLDRSGAPAFAVDAAHTDFAPFTIPDSTSTPADASLPPEPEVAPKQERADFGKFAARYTGPTPPVVTTRWGSLPWAALGEVSRAWQPAVLTPGQSFDCLMDYLVLWRSGKQRDDNGILHIAWVAYYALHLVIAEFQEKR